MLVIEPALFGLGKMTPSPSPIRENLGVISVKDTQFSVGSCEIEGECGWLDKPEIDGRTTGGIG